MGKKKIFYAVVAFCSVTLSLCAHLNEYVKSKKLTEQLSSTQNELLNTNTMLQTERAISASLDRELVEVCNELETANETIADLQAIQCEFVYMGNFKLTHYCVERFEHICGTGDGLTATSTQVTPGKTIAVDPNVIPYGTTVYIEGYGFYAAEDCGGSIQGQHIDIAVDTHEQAMSMGTKSGGVWLLVEKH
jgi:3D (Asp-Asp-Asp) domain-containing protein